MREVRVLLHEILIAIEQVEAYVADHSPDEIAEDGIRFDAIRYNLLIIGEAVKHLPEEVLRHAPEVPWSAMARLRDHLAHRYYETEAGIVHRIASQDIPQVKPHIERLLKDH